jgi:catechol 2,3-dioxygenase-like lactoylglutathione lyase family enzyme
MLGDMAIQRMDNVAIVVDDLDAAVAFFTELGMELEGKGQIEGPVRTAPSDSTASGPRSR